MRYHCWHNLSSPKLSMSEAKFSSDIQVFRPVLSIQAISKEFYIELVFGCYYIIRYTLHNCGPIEEIVFHTSGFLLSLQKLAEAQDLPLNEILLTRMMWKEILLDINIYTRYENIEYYVSRAKELLPVIQSAVCLLPATTHCQSERYCLEHSIAGAILVLELDIYFRFYFA